MMKALQPLVMAIILATSQQPAARMPTAHIEGIVVDIANGNVLKGAQVQLRGQTEQAYRRVVTDTAGRFSFDEVVPGTTIMLVSHEGFLGETITEDVAPNAREVRREE